MKPRPKKVDEGGDEDWLVTFSDTISLLQAFFVMLVSFSKIDIPTFEKVQAGIK
ncbi:MAG: flagellar motor protein MotB, partial [Alphaproteobacteria bacterium]